MKKLTISRTDSLTFGEGCEKYLDNCRQRNLRKGTINHYRQSYTQFFKYFDPDMPVAEFNKAMYDDFVLHLQEVLCNDISINSYLRDLITTLHFLMGEGYVQHFKMSAIKTDKNSIKTYTEDELTRLLQKPNIHKSSFTEYQAWVFSLLGLFAGTLGAFLSKYQTAVNIVSGGLVILFGLSYLEVIHLPFFKGMQRKGNATTVLSAFLFGVIYSVSLTPCVGAFLGSALSMAATSGTAFRGTLLLVVYSLGLGVPFLLSALLIEQLSGAFGFIKRHYRVINLVCGIFLIVVGILMLFGMMNALLALFA